METRFLIPMLPLLAIAGAVALVELVDRLPAKRLRRATLALAFATATAFLVIGQGQVLAGTTTWRGSQGGAMLASSGPASRWRALC